MNWTRANCSNCADESAGEARVLCALSCFARNSKQQNTPETAILSRVMESLLTTEQVADRLQVHEETVRRYVRSGELPAIRKGRLIRITSKAVDEFLKPDETKTSWAQAAKRMAPVYAEAIAQGGELTVSSTMSGAYIPTGTTTTEGTDEA